MCAGPLEHRARKAIAQHRLPDELVRQFAECCDRYGFDSGPVRGCLLALVRAVWSQPNAYVTNLDGYDGYGWVCIVDGVEGAPRGGVAWFEGEPDSEGTALVVAIEEAP